MSVQNDNTLVTKGDLKTLFSDKIAPYLGQNLTLRTNVSDYYSTTEKIVGVWTDGRPLYQITYNFTMPSANVDYTIGTLPTGANPKQMFGGIEWAANSYIEVNYYDSSAPTSCLCYVYNRAIKIIGRDQDLANRPAFVTVKYTKSSDAANSAVATPGCYDINFPNTQPNGSEIYFGNGLYGLRKQGTATVSELRPGLVLVEGVSTSAVCWSKGGMIDMSKTAGTNWYDINGVQDKSSPYRPLVTNTSGRFRFYCLQCEGYSDSTSLQYNIWITYTK